MDGIFVPNISFGFPVIAAIKGKTGMVLDVHLMVSEPIRYLKETVVSGADIVTVHFEACKDVAATLRAIREAGLRASLSVKPKTPIEVVYPYLEMIDMILVMTVEPGYGGQKLIPETIEKVRVLRGELGARGLSVEIEVDGGVTPENAGLLIEAGADVLVAGSSVFRAADRAAAIAALRK
jgi:ribulose-phosphate 3-epimerase